MAHRPTYTTARRNDPWYEHTPEQAPVVASTSWNPRSLQRPSRHESEHNSEHRGSSIIRSVTPPASFTVAPRLDVEGWISANRGTFVTDHDPTTRGFVEREPRRSASQTSLGSSHMSAAETDDARHHIALLSAMSSLPGQALTQRPAVPRRVATGPPSNLDVGKMDSEPIWIPEPSPRFHVSSEVEPAAPTPPPTLPVPPRAASEVVTPRHVDAETDMVRPPSHLGTSGLVHTTQRRRHHEEPVAASDAEQSRQRRRLGGALQGPSFDDVTPSSAPDPLSPVLIRQERLIQSHRAAYGRADAAAPYAPWLPTPHEGIPEQSRLLAPTLHDSLSVAGATAMAVRHTVMSARAVIATRAIEASEAVVRREILRHEEASHALVAAVADELYHRIIAERHEHSAWSLLESRVAFLNERCGLYIRRRVKMEQEEATERHSIFAAEEDARVGLGASTANMRRLHAVADGPNAVRRAEAAERRQAYSIFVSERTTLLLKMTLVLEQFHRERILGFGAACNFGGTRSWQHFADRFSLDGSLRRLSEAPILTSNVSVWSGEDLNKTLLQLRFGKSVAADLRAPSGEKSVVGVTAAVSQLCDAGSLGYAGFAEVAVPFTRFIITEAVLRCALHDAEQRHRVEINAWWQQQRPSFIPANGFSMRTAHTTRGTTRLVSPRSDRRVASDVAVGGNALRWNEEMHGDRYKQHNASSEQHIFSTRSKPTTPPLYDFDTNTATSATKSVSNSTDDMAHLQHDAESLFRLGDMDNSGRLTLPSVVAVFRLVGIESDLRKISVAFNAAIDSRAAAMQLTARETNRMRHHEGVDLLGFEMLVNRLRR